MPTAPAPEPVPAITANLALAFPTQGQAYAFIDGLNFVGDDRVTVLDTKTSGCGRTTIYLLDERQ